MKSLFLCLFGLAALGCFTACEKQPYSKLEKITAHGHHDDAAGDHGHDKKHDKH